MNFAAALTAGWALTHHWVILLWGFLAALVVAGVVIVHRDGRADDAKYQPAHGTRPGAHPGPGQGTGRQAPSPRRRLPVPRDPFDGDWPTLKLSHEWPPAREWPCTEDTPPPAPAGVPGGGQFPAAPVHPVAGKPPGPDLPAPGPGGHQPEPWEAAATYEQAWQARTGTLSISDGDWPWLAEGQYGHAALSGSQIMRALTDDDLDRIGELIRARDGGAS